MKMQQKRKFQKLQKIQKNNTGNGSGNNNNNNGSGNNDSTTTKPGNGNNLPQTGGIPATAVGLLGAVIGTLGVTMVKRKK